MESLAIYGKRTALAAHNRRYRGTATIISSTCTCRDCAGGKVGCEGVEWCGPSLFAAPCADTPHIATPLCFYQYYFEKVLVTTSDVSSISLGSIVVFASCVIHLPVVCPTDVCSLIPYCNPSWNAPTVLRKNYLKLVWGDDCCTERVTAANITPL